jgi:hypothetical protein
LKDIVVIKDIASDNKELRQRIIGEVGEIVWHDDRIEGRLVRLLDSNVAQSDYDKIVQATDYQSVNQYPDNFKVIVGVELDEEDVQTLVDDAYEQEGNCVIRTGGTVVTKFNGKIYISKNPMVNDRV